jgi:hypothetical protein
VASSSSGWTFLARAYWGGSYNGELKQLMLRHAFRFVRRVVFLVDPANIRSQQAVERIGAIRAGRRRDGAGRESLVFTCVGGFMGAEPYYYFVPYQKDVGAALQASDADGTRSILDIEAVSERISSAPLARTSSERSSRSFPDLGGSNDGQLH